MKRIVLTILILLLLPVAAAQAGTATHYQDLVLGPSVGADEPFFKDGIFMLGDKKIALKQGALPSNKMVAYDEEKGEITVNSDKSISEVDKGVAVIQLMDALAVQAIEPAAGQ
jgi:hypothetical protein